MITSSGRIAIVNGASVIIIARDLLTITSYIRITVIKSTCIQETRYIIICTSDDSVTIINMTLVRSLTGRTDIVENTA
jgi:hypothetical protein